MPFVLLKHNRAITLIKPDEKCLYSLFGRSQNTKRNFLCIRFCFFQTNILQESHSFLVINLKLPAAFFNVSLINLSPSELHGNNLFCIFIKSHVFVVENYLILVEASL